MKRYYPKIKWSKNSWIHNVFRAFEYIFGRKIGIRPELASEAWHFKGKTVVQYKFYTFESLLAYTEGFVRAYFRKKFAFELVGVPQFSLAGVGNPALPFFYFAIAFDAATEKFQTAATSATWTHNAAGSNRIVEIFMGSMENILGTTATYGGDSATALQDAGSVIRVKHWQKIAPATGDQTIVVNRESAGGTGLRCTAISYSGADQTQDTQVIGTNYISTGATSIGLTLNPTSGNGWFVGAMICSTDGTATSITNGTIRGPNGYITGGDSNAEISASTTLTWNTASSNTYLAVAGCVIETEGGAPAAERSKNLLLLGVT